ncbi:hypothetical protein [Biostraticola tofi]|uniref:hypothetical protein n=1 Tax=Biostraticola tofi TaxID=466109 RepID=UPI00104DD233|nr:hypothetical protein [Biostraticola tofi]
MHTATTTVFLEVTQLMIRNLPALSNPVAGHERRLYAIAPSAIITVFRRRFRSGCACRDPRAGTALSAC